MSNTDISRIVINGKSKEIVSAIKLELNNGADPIHLINTMTDAMKVVGERYQHSEIQISDMFSAAQTMKKGVTYLTPLIKGEKESFIGKVIVGTARGDLHDIGKGLVVTMLQAVGAQVIDLGIDVPPETFAESIELNPECKIVLISASLDSTVETVKETINFLKKEKLRDNVKIIVGGASVNIDTVKDVGADLYGATATLTAVIVKDLLL